MRQLRAFWLRVRSLWRPVATDRDLDDEIHSHLAASTAEYVARGLSLEDAHAAARRSFGSIAHFKDACVDARGTRWISDLTQDLRFALRLLIKERWFAVVAVTAVALGIGTNTAIFSVVNAVLLRPLPYPDADRIMMLVNRSPSGMTTPIGSSTRLFAWEQHTTAFEDLSAYTLTGVNLTSHDDPEGLIAAQVTVDFFRLFGKRMTEGRSFDLDECRPGGGAVVILGHGFWQRRFGGDRTIVGQTISLDGHAHLVIGVLESDFDFRTLPYSWPTDVWVPLQLDSAGVTDKHYLIAAARLKPRVPLARAREEAHRAAAGYRRDFPNDINAQASFDIEPLDGVVVREVRSSLLILTGAVALVLLIACVNVAILLLARGSARGREMAIRTSLGASQGRIIRQLLTESAVLVTLGGILGVPSAMLGVRALIVLAPATTPRIQDGSGVPIDWRVLVFTLVITAATGMAFGLWPALRAGRGDLTSALKRTTGRWRRAGQHRGRAVLVIAETALAVVLLIGAGLLLRTLAALHAVDTGLDARQVLTLPMLLTASRFDHTSAVTALVHAGTDRVRSLPGVIEVSTTCCVPMFGGYQQPFDIVGRPAGETVLAGWIDVSPRYFDALRIPVIRGRAFVDGDHTGSPGVVMINETMARRFWPHGNPLADRLIIGTGVGSEWQDVPRQIIGIVGDVRDGGLDREPIPMMYVPTAQLPDQLTRLHTRLPLMWVVRTNGDPSSRLQASIQHELAEASGGIPVAPGTKRLEEYIIGSLALRQFETVLLALFAAVALLLAAIGVYGVMAYVVQQRTHEIGIRLALGASAPLVRRMVVAQGMTLASTGVMLGTVSGLILARVLEGLLFGVTAHDPLVVIGVACLLSAAALVAVWVPGGVACRVEPVVALRSE